MDFVDEVLFLFAYPDWMRPYYVVLIVLAILFGLLLFVKQPFFKIADARSPKKRWAGLAISMILITTAFESFQYTKLLQFEDSPRCQSIEHQVLYLPLWVDQDLKPYLGDTYDSYLTNCTTLSARIDAAHSGWTRHITMVVHVLLSFLMVVSLTICLTSINHARKKGGLNNE